jgi:signal peptidase
VLFQLLNFLNVVASGLMMWKALCLVTNSESPIVVVLSCVRRAAAEGVS